MAQPPSGARDEEFPEPPRLRRLRLMVTVLILVLIAGVVTVVGALVINLAALTGGALSGGVAAESLSLPPGEEIVAVGEGRGSLILVTRDAAGIERLRRFDRESGALLSATDVRRE